MSKYRLKKWYPSLPKAWKKGDIVHKRKGVYVKKSLPFEKSGRVPVFEVEDNPEFWEEVKEGNYEILKFKDDSNRIWIRRCKCNDPKPECNPLFDCGNLTNGLNFMMQNRCYIIHSVKRLSDSEVFTIGDRINVGGGHKPKRTIIGFKPEREPFIVHQEIDEGKQNGGYSKIDSIDHIKQPLFTTEDGVEIYEGDQYAFVTDDYSYHIGIAPDEIDENYGNSVISRLSSGKMAQEWIMENRPRFSKADIKEVFSSVREDTVVVPRVGWVDFEYFIEQLNEKAK